MSDETQWCYPMTCDDDWRPADSREEAIRESLETMWEAAPSEDLSPGTWAVTVKIGQRQAPDLSRFFDAESLLESIDERSCDEAMLDYDDAAIFGLRPWWKHWSKVPHVSDAKKERMIEDRRRLDELEGELLEVLRAFAARYGYAPRWWWVVREQDIALEVELDEHCHIKGWTEVAP